MYQSIFLLGFCCLIIRLGAHAQVRSSQKSVAAESQAGAGLLPLPQQMQLTAKRFSISANWYIAADRALAGEQAVISLQQGLKESNLPLNVT